MKQKILLAILLLVVVFGCKKDKNGPDINKGLVSYFNFEDNVTDQQGYAKNGVGNALFAPGKIGNALSFNGIDQKMVFSPKSPQTFSEISLVFWVKSMDKSNGKFFIKNPAFQFLTFGGNTIIFQISHSNGSAAVSGSKTYEQWTHIAGVFDGQTIKIYINGILTQGPNISGEFKGFEQDLILGNNNSDYWSGSIDELRIYNRALSEEEVTMLYNMK